MSIGEAIDKLIRANIKTWHKDTLLKDRHNNWSPKNLNKEEIAKIFLEARVHNAERSEMRDIIDNSCGQESFSAKVNYYGKKNSN